MSISFGNKNVSELRFGTRNVTEVYFGDKLVWSGKQFVMGDERWVCIEYVADKTEMISTIGIFQDKSTDDGWMWVMEDNHCVALSTTQGTSHETKYRLNGYLRTHQFSNLKFYKNHTYYICWKHGQWANDSSTPDYFAYYRGKTGIYKTVCIAGLVNTITNDAGLYEYMGELTSVDWDTVMRFPTDTAFYLTFYNSDACCVRTAAYPTTSSDPSVSLYKGQVDNSAGGDYNTIILPKLYDFWFTMNENDVMFDKRSTDNASAFYKRKANYTSNAYRGTLNEWNELSVVDKNDIFYWIGGFQSQSFGDITLFKANESLLNLVGVVDGSSEWTGLTPVKKMAKMFMMIGNTPGTILAYMSYSDIGSSDYNGWFSRLYFYKSENNENNHITSLTPIIEEPTETHELDIYYKGQTTADDGWLDSDGNPITDECIVVNASSSEQPVWKKLQDVSLFFPTYKNADDVDITTDNIFTYISADDIATQQNIRDDVLTKISNVNSNTLAIKNAEINPSRKKYYLEINGVEV